MRCFCLFQPLYPWSPAGKFERPCLFRGRFFGEPLGWAFGAAGGSSSGAFRLTPALALLVAGSGSKWKTTEAVVCSCCNAMSTGISPFLSARKSDLT